MPIVGQFDDMMEIAPLIFCGVRNIVEDGIIFNLDASDTNSITVETGTDRVRQWDDLSGNGNHATQPTASRQPLTNTDTVNGLNAISFDGINDHFIMPNLSSDFSTATEFSIFVVIKQNSADSEFRTIFASSVAGSNRTLIQNQQDQAIITTTFTGSFNPKSEVLTDTTNPHLVTMLNSPPTTVTGFLDETEMTNTTRTGASSSTPGTRIAARTTNDFTWDGLICQIIGYDRILTTEEIAQNSTALNAKWGI